MKSNMGVIDRVIRIAIAGVLLYLGLIVHRDSALGIGLAFLSIIPVLTALLGNCPLYKLLGISTRKVNPSLRSK
ncbi:MAG: DUF2892 domain-containing protein [Rivularia sp. (in: cyanobacteria)]